MTAATAQTFISTHRSGLAMSVVLHGLILLGLGSSLMVMPNQPMHLLAIEAVLIDPNSLHRVAKPEPVKEQPKPEPEKDLKAEREQQERARERQAEQRKQQEAQKQREQEQKVQQERAAAETRQKAEAEQRAKVEQERQAAEARAKADAEAEAQRQAKAAADKKARVQATRQAALVAAMEEEEALLAAQASGEMSRYIALIVQKVERNWIQPATAQAIGLQCEVLVQQLPNGDVVDVRTQTCNADASVQRSIENAVLRASPLPLPENRALFERSLIFTFKPEQ
jgi:colicin import membrane protein